MRSRLMSSTFGLALIVASVSCLADQPQNADLLEQGKALFTTKAVPACAICHALADAGATGTIGPDLDELKPDEARIKKALHEGIGVMPSFATTMTEDEMNAVASYVIHATAPAQ